MTNSKTTKRALFMSVVSLLVCFTMLMGATFAWFTDTVKSSGNIIKAGNLDVEMYWAEGGEDVPVNTEEWEDAATNAIFDHDLWEPGYVQARHLKIANVGSLALKYELRILANGDVSILSDVIDVYYVDTATKLDRTTVENAEKLGTLTDILDETKATAIFNTIKGKLDAGKEKTLTLALKMRESANNDYQNLAIGSDFAVQLLATQVEAEFDSFGDDYDKDANVVATGKDGNTSFNVPTSNGGTFGFSIPTEALADGATTVTHNVSVPTAVYVYPETIDDTLKQVISFDISIANIKEDNTAPITVTYQLPEGEDYVGVEKVLHNGTDVTSTASYDATTRTITFTTTSFSPFEIIMDIGATVIPESYTNDEAIEMLTAAKDGAIIDGKGRIITFADNVANKWSFLIQNGVTFRNMTLTAKGDGTTVMVYGANKNVKMKNVTFQNTKSGKKAIEISTNSRKSFILEDCTIKGKAYVQGTNVTFINCSFNTNMNLESATNYTFDNCTFTVSGAITMNSSLSNILIQNCEFKYANAIRLYSGMPQPTNVQLINNTYKTPLVKPDSGVDYEGWKTAEAWIEEGNVQAQTK